MVGVAYKREGGGGKQCFSLMMYRLSTNNALYSASLSFTMLDFLLTLFETLNCYYFESNISSMLHRSVVSKKVL